MKSYRTKVPTHSGKVESYIEVFLTSGDHCVRKNNQLRRKVKTKVYHHIRFRCMLFITFNQTSNDDESF